MADRFPRHIVPMLAASIAAPADVENYAYEFKWDGFRALASWDGRRFELTSRNQLDFRDDFPVIDRLADDLKRRGPIILDGELVVFDERGRPDFHRLQNARGRTDPTYVIFDVLYAGGRNLMKRPYRERRTILDALRLSGPNWRVPPSETARPDEILAVSRQRGYEGLIAKRLDSPYRPGERTGEWIKIKLARRQEFVIGGWLPGEGANTGTLGSLLLGYQQKKSLVFAGKVGTGFSRDDREALVRFLRRIPMETSPFAERVPFRGSHFVRPALVCEVEFFEWTPDGKVRHPVFKGLRPDKDAADVIREPVSR